MGEENEDENTGISTSTLFHFTNSVDNIVNILTNNFSPKYCLEELMYLVPEGTIFHKFGNIAIPMVSFCDIPLSKIKYHIKEYGKYGIGLTKDWGIKNKINPVFYTIQNTNVTEILKEMINRMAPYEEHLNKDCDREKTSEIEIILSLLYKYTKLLEHIKPYEGISYKSGTIRRFYDEREWRFVPDAVEMMDKGLASALIKNSFENPGILQEYNSKMENVKLLFEPRDVKYIIVDKEEEIFDIVERIRRIKIRYSVYDVMLLETRVISMEQILKDF
jgi:hypothetical protein